MIADAVPPEAGPVLVVKLSSIGDVVHAIPGVAALARQRGPVDWLVEPPAAPLVASLPFVRRTHVLAADAALAAGWGALSEELDRLAGELRACRYAVAVDLQGLLRSSLWTVWSGARTRVGRGRWPWLHRSVAMYDGATPHAVENTARALSLLGVEAAAVADAGEEAGRELARALAPRTARLRRDLGLCRPYRVLMPAARWPSKRLPLGEIDLPRGVTHVFVGGPDAAGLVPARGGVIDCTGRLGLLDSVALALGAERVVAADTGPAHVAALAGARVVGCYGPTRPARTGLRGPAASSRSAACGGCERRRCSRAAACLEPVVREAAGTPPPAEAPVRAPAPDGARRRVRPSRDR